VKGNLGYGNSYDDYDDTSLATPIDNTLPPELASECDPTDIMALDTGLPFYQHFYSGGVRDLRGYDYNTLGPKDRFCRAVGGDFKVASRKSRFPPFLGEQRVPESRSLWTLVTCTRTSMPLKLTRYGILGPVRYLGSAHRADRHKLRISSGRSLGPNRGPAILFGTTFRPWSEAGRKLSPLTGPRMQAPILFGFFEKLT
jgi:hypothetical protein